MTKKLVISAFAASLVLGGASFAYADQQSNTASTFGVGAAQANKSGAQAGAISAGKAQYAVPQQKNKKRRGKDDHQSHSGGSMSGGAEVTLPNSASTYTTGAAYTDRNRASAAGSTGGAASGAGTQSTSSGLTVAADVYKQGGSAVVEGGSTAESREPRRRPN